MIRWLKAKGPKRAEIERIATGDRVGRRAPRALLFACLTIAVAQDGCGPRLGDAEARAKVQAELGTIICGSYPTVDEHGRQTTRPEYYIVYSMNRKLQYFPEFASAVGMRTVATCDEARAFSVAYAKYFAAHPYFDKNLPSAPSTARLPQLPTAPPGEAMVHKIFNGSPTGPASNDSNPYPVVEISHNFVRGARFFNGDLINPPNGDATSVSCTGTFINKNFILTAAHCFEKVALQFDPNRPLVVNRTQWVTSQEWIIEWPDSNGNLASTLDDNGKPMTKVGFGSLTVSGAWTIVHPSFSDVMAAPFYPSNFNQENPALNAFYDIALLFIPPVQNDHGLAPNAEKSSWDVQVEGEDSLLSGWALKVYGYGPSSNVNTLPSPLLDSGLPHYANSDRLNAISGPPSVLNGGIKTNGRPLEPNSEVTTTVDFTMPWPSWALCHSDSGGPMVREVRDANTNVLVSTVIVAVASSIGPGNLVGSLPCGSNPGVTSSWARTDIAVPFLEDTIMHWQLGPDFNLDDHTFKDNGRPHSYLQLHGESCTTDCDCLPNEFCYNPIRDPNAPQGCLSCSDVVRDCGCLMGQCLPTPNASPEAGTDGGRQCDAMP